MSSESQATSAPAHPLLRRMCAQLEAPWLDADRFDGWAGAAGHALAVFTEDPAQHPETLDLAVIVPEIARAFEARFRTGVLAPAAARAIAPRYGFRRWPALVLLKDGRYVGAVDGLRDWHDYVERLAELLAAEPTRAPLGIAIRSAGDAPACH